MEKTDKLIKSFKNKTFFDSIKCAIRGMYKAFNKEKNFKFYLGIASIFAVLNMYFKVDTHWWVGYIITTCGVFASELVNTAIERLADEVTTEIRVLVGEAKDIAASAVLFWGFGFFIIEILALI